MSSLYSFLLLPQNYTAEEILIGSTITNPDILIWIIQNLDGQYLFIESHRIIYGHILKLQQDHNVDPVNLAYSLKANGLLKQIGGITRITSLIKLGQIFNLSNNLHFYLKQIIKIIYTNYNRRLIIQYGYNIIKLGYNYEFSNQLLSIKASQYLNYITSNINSENLDNLQSLIGLIVQEIQTTKISYISANKTLYSGFKDLDILTNGLPIGDLIVIAGRPSMGKTSLVMNITYHLLKYFQSQVCIFSLEMTKKQILHKIISIGSGISIDTLKSKIITKNQWNIIQRICRELLVTNVYINDNPNISIDDITHISKTIIDNNIKSSIIIIDYLQLIHETNIALESRNQELSHITRKLKILAQSLKLPIIVLSQLNRSIDKRVNKQPLLSDLKESGCIHSTILVKKNIINSLQIKTIFQHVNQISILELTNKIYNSQSYIYKNRIKNIYNTEQYTFRCKIDSIYIKITDNHLLLNEQQWIRQNVLKKHSSFIKLNTTKKNYYTIEKIYLRTVCFENYTTVYDIIRYQYLNFVCNKIILHNSIEQDADIVMMLYKNYISRSIENTSALKKIDIIVCKNRNGPIGAFQLHFEPETTAFMSIKDCS